ncbi:MAG: hypothetical protein ACRDYW_07175 [Acidimicrobiales bacterium]
MVAATALSVGVVVGPAAAVGAQDSPASVLPSVVEQPQVKGVQLARTGSDIDGEVIVGIGLTLAGAAFAVTARERRRRLEAQV